MLRRGRGFDPTYDRHATALNRQMIDAIREIYGLDPLPGPRLSTRVAKGGAGVRLQRALRGQA